MIGFGKEFERTMSLIFGLAVVGAVGLLAMLLILVYLVFAHVSIAIV